MLVLLSALAVAAEPRAYTLEEALAALDAHNPTLARGAAAVEGAKGATLVSAAPALPSFTLGGNYTRNNEEVRFDLSALFDALGTVAAMTGQDPPEAPDPMVLQPLDAWTGQATLRVPLAAPSSWATIAANRHVVRAAGAQLDASRDALRGAAVQGIWAEAAAEQLASAQSASVERARQLETTATKALTAGTGTRLGVLQTQAELARREGDLLATQATLDKARLSVGALLGVDGPVSVTLPAAAGADALDEDALVQEALGARGEVRAAQEQLTAAQGALLAVRLGAAPTVSATGTALASTEPFVTGEDTAWKATVDLSWPILQGGLRAGSAQRAQAAVADAEAALAAAKLSVAKDVRAALADLGAARARVAATDRQRALAEEAAAVAQRGFAEGTVDTPTVLDALDRLDVANALGVDARARLGMAQAALTSATARW